MRTLTLLACLTAVPAVAAPVSYNLEGGHVAVMVRYDRTALMAGHDHVLSTKAFTGKVTLDAQAPSACSVSIQFPVSTLEVDAPGMRTRYSLTGDTPEGDKDNIKKNALSKGQLDATTYPTIKFDSTACTRAGTKLTVQGNLTVRGKAKAVSAVMDVTEGAQFGAKGSFTAKHTDFGFEPYTALLGSLRNANDLTFYVDVAGKPAP
jgi:polyisoprenoid-binding protein YceI